MKVQSNSKTAKIRQLKAKSRQFSFSLRNFGCAMGMFSGGCMFCHRGMANNLQGCQRLRTPRLSVLGPQLWLRVFPMQTIWCSFRRVPSGNFTQLSKITIVAGKTHYQFPFSNSHVTNHQRVNHVGVLNVIGRFKLYSNCFGMMTPVDWQSVMRLKAPTRDDSWMPCPTT